MRYLLATRLFGASEVNQQIALARLEGISPGSALDDLARNLGYVRWRNPYTGCREWVREEVFLAHGGGGSHYRHGSFLKKIARQKVSAERRQEIARAGGLARARRTKNADNQ